MKDSVSNSALQPRKSAARIYPSVEELDLHLYRFVSKNPAVYCSTYAKYNESSLDGCWLDLTTFNDYEEFIGFCLRIHCDEEDPELMFQDYENFPSELYSESCITEDAFDKIIQYSEFAKDDRDAIDAFIVCFSADEMDNFEERYCGKWDSKLDFTYDLVDELYDINKMMGSLACYFDYVRFSQDLFMTDYEFANGYVFRNC